MDGNSIQNRGEITLYRRITQALVLVLIFLIPAGNILRFDLAARRFILLGQNFFLTDLYLLVLFFILLLLFLVLFSRVMGRIFCGWFCPQNTWAEMGDHLIRLLGKRRKDREDYWKIGWSILSTLFIMAFFSLTVMAFFVPLPKIWQALFSGESSEFIAVSLTKLNFLGLLNILLVRHTFCWSVCPYAIFQRYLHTPSSLRVAFSADACSDCGRCDRACFMKLNPRELDAPNCINCASCITACERQARRRGVSSSLAFALGQRKQGQPEKGRTVSYWDARLGLVTIAMVFLGTIFTYGVLHHKTLNVTLHRELLELAEIRDGQVTSHYILRVAATKEIPQGLNLSVVDGAGRPWQEAVLEPGRILPPLVIDKEIEFTLRVPVTSLERVVTPAVIQVKKADASISQEVRVNIFRPGG